MLEKINELKKYEGDYTIMDKSFQFNLPTVDELFDLTGKLGNEVDAIEHKVDLFYKNKMGEIASKISGVKQIQYKKSLGVAFLVNTDRRYNTTYVEQRIKKVYGTMEYYKELVKHDINKLNQLSELNQETYGLEDEIDASLRLCKRIEVEIMKVVAQNIYDDVVVS